MEPGVCQYTFSAIASSGCRFSRQVFFIIGGHKVWIKGWFTGSWSCCRGDEIAAQYAFRFIDRHMLMFGTIFILHILQKGLLVLGSIGCRVLRINIDSHVPLPQQSQLLQRIEYVGWNENHTCRWSHVSIIFGHRLSSWLHSEEQVFLPLSLLLCQSSHNAIHVIEHVVIDCDKMMQCDCMPLWHPQGPILEWPQYLQDILHKRPFILCCEEWPGLTVFGISEPLEAEFA